MLEVALTLSLYPGQINLTAANTAQTAKAQNHEASFVLGTLSVQCWQGKDE